LKKKSENLKSKIDLPVSLASDPAITPGLVKEHGLTPREYQNILKILGRKPTYTELGIFSVMWSEHCSYKTSKPILKGFPTKGPRVLQGPGENAGIVDIGGGYAITFKIESHNHPSAIEPYQGAATGVGGILRDVFTMGARPIACLDSLRFGSLADPHVRQLVKGVVAGIGGYGNCVGIPTVAGETVFDDVYRDNCLVNAMAVGLLKHKEIARGIASGPGNSVIYIGSTTGRDGIHGATFASVELSEQSEEKRSAVQVADPFMEKLLMEATLELIRNGLLVGIQDMGAAGFTSSSVEMAFRGKSGMDLEVNSVPKRETGMAPYEVMLSESQERMLLVAKKGREKQVMDVLEKWGLHAAVVGTVTDTGRHRVFANGVLVSDIPAAALADDHHPYFPVAHRPEKEPAYLKKTRAFQAGGLPVPKNLSAAFLKLWASPNLADFKWIYRQYDHMVRTNTLVLPGSDAAVLRIKENGRGIALKTDGNGRYCYLDPFEGGKIAVAEAARNVAMSGAVPIACTDCLNFGNPEDPEIMWQLHQAVKGMAEACQALGTPVVSGNVSLYNESPKWAIDPTPVVGMLGLMEPVMVKGAKVLRHATQWFKKSGDLVYLAGRTLEELGGTEYLAVVHGLKTGLPPRLNLEWEKALQKLAVEAVREDLVASAHDLSDGGLAVGLAECCVSRKLSGHGPIGAKVGLKASLRLDALLFGETQSRALFSVEPEKQNAFETLAKKFKVPLSLLGHVGGDRLRIEAQGGRGAKALLDLKVAELENISSKAFKELGE
jgi:phosphoribosylformylglycinamidine synthase